LLGLGIGTAITGVSGVVDAYQPGTTFGIISRLSTGLHFTDIGARSTTLGFYWLRRSMNGIGVTFDAAGSLFLTAQGRPS